MNNPMNKPMNICEKSLNFFSLQVIHRFVHKVIHKIFYKKHRHIRHFLRFPLFTQPIINNKNIKDI